MTKTIQATINAEQETIYLKKPLFDCLVEALRRELMFSDTDLNRNKSLTEKWLRLGFPSTYKQVVLEGYMSPVFHPTIPKVVNWYKLTKKGAKVIQFWLDQKVTLGNFCAFDPDMTISRQIPANILEN
jgi:hypothetical protein